MESLRPAVEYLLKVLGLQFSSARFLLRWSEELNALGLIFLENHYLKYHGATFAETFYNLHRTPADSSAALPSSGRVRAVSIFFTVVLPYFKRQLGYYLEEGAQPINIRGRSVALPPWLLSTLPWLNFFFESAMFGYSVAFLFNKTDYYTPFLHLQKIVLHRLSPQELQKLNAIRELKRELVLSRTPALLRFFIRIGHLFFDYLKYILPLSIFLIKFLEWWSQQNKEATAKALPTPPAPPAPRRSIAVPFLEDPACCQLCQQPRTNSAIAGGSGYAFCYPCIHRWISEQGTCPITLVPLTIAQISKIFDKA